MYSLQNFLKSNFDFLSYVPDVTRFASIYHNNTMLDTPCNLSSDCGHKVFFSWTQRYIVQFKNRIENRLLCGCQLVLLSTAAPPLVRILALSVFPKDTTACYAQCEHQTCNLTITIRQSIRLSYAAASRPQACQH